MSGIAAILHEHASQSAVGRSFSIVEDEAQFEIGKGARPGEIRDKVGPNESREVFDGAEAPWQDLDIDYGDNREHEGRQKRQRPQQSPWRDARSGHNNEFAVTVEFVQGVKDPGEQSDRRDYRH